MVGLRKFTGTTCVSMNLAVESRFSMVLVPSRCRKKAWVATSVNDAFCGSSMIGNSVLLIFVRSYSSFTFSSPVVGEVGCSNFWPNWFSIVFHSWLLPPTNSLL